MLALTLTVRAGLAFRRRDHTRALKPLRQALRLARGSGSADRMTNAVELAAHAPQYRGRAREVATLVGAVEVGRRGYSLLAPTRQSACCVYSPAPFRNEKSGERVDAPGGWLVGEKGKST